MLTHLTNSLDNLLSMLEIGLIYFPNERKVFSNLTANTGLPDIKLSEPQCKGMISFTDLPFDAMSSHINRFGSFGVVLDKQWLISQGACKVIYVGNEGAVFNSFASLFSSLAPKLNTNNDNFLEQLIRKNPEFAKSVGAASYAELLKLHEYMQSDEYDAESEWRIIRPHEFSWSEGMLESEVNKYCLLMAKNKIVESLLIEPKYVKSLICLRKEKDILESNLFGKWKDIEIILH